MQTQSRPAERTRMRATAVLLTIGATLALMLNGAPARASFHEPGDAVACDRTARGNLVDVQVLVEGRSAPLYYAPGRWDRRYFQAFRGRHYSLRVTNRTDQRVGVLIAVDGLNVVNGERSSLDRGESMYVLGPWETATIRGWRTSLEQVRQFVFVDEQRSYAERTGQANGDMGWIRVLAFEERRPVAWFDRPEIRRFRGNEPGGRADDGLREPESRDAKPQANAAPLLGQDRVMKEEAGAPRSAEKSLAGGMAGAPQAEAYPGTGWGERRQDPVRETWFVAAGGPRDHLVFRYEYAPELRALGISLDGDRLGERERGQLGFAKPPRW
jgi:hypothetical protein